MAAIEPYLLGLKRLPKRRGPIKTYPTASWECDPCHADWSGGGDIIAAVDQEKSRRVDQRMRMRGEYVKDVNGCGWSGTIRKTTHPAFMKPHMHRR